MKSIYYVSGELICMSDSPMPVFCTTGNVSAKLFAGALLFALLTILSSKDGFTQQQAFRSPAGTDYLLYTPPGYFSSTSNFPLLISLHSQGEVGTDLAELTSKNPEQMPSRLIYLNKWPQDLPFIVLTPQLKPTLADPDPQWPADYIDEVVRLVMQNYRVDATRVYLTGISRGGTGCWTYASAYPEKIAAIVALSGRSDPRMACAIKNIPIWAFHGDGDTVAPTFYTTSMLNAINSCTPMGVYTPHLTTLNAKGHEGWNEVYNGSNGYRIYEWLLKFKKNELLNKSPYVGAGPDRKIPLQSFPLTIVGDYFDVDGTINTINWVQVSGPALTLTNANGKFLSLSNLKAGICVFELSVTDDDGAIASDRVSVEIVESASTLKVTGLVLVNGSTNADISPLTNDMTIDKYAMSLTEINIRAATTSDVYSTRFSINSDANTRTVNSTSLPYMKPQTTSPEWKVPTGEYVICATPFSKSNGLGVQGVSQCFKINVTDGQKCEGTGEITREVWNNITGTSISSIPVSTIPSSSNGLLTFESPLNAGDNYGERVSGYLCPPVSGSYVFYISSNDNSELWLSTDDTPAHKVKIAYVTGYTNRLQWDKYLSQKSLPVNLVGNRRYYIEVLHKESTGSDHMAVGWQLPNQVLERPIPGNRLTPFKIVPNSPPIITITSPVNNQSFTDPSTIKIIVKTSDLDGQVLIVEFFRNSVKLGQDNISGFQFDWLNPVSGNSVLTARAIDSEGATTVSAPISINVVRPTVSGTIRAEYWTGISGVIISDIPVNSPPTSTSSLTSYESPSNIGDNYGTRIRGYILAPSSGEYTFWIASNDRSELWLSTDELPSNKQKIASVTGYTLSRQWTKYSTQQSTGITLAGGKKYYIEALHKEGVGSDHVAVGWRLPDGVFERPIPGSRLSPFENTSSFASGDMKIIDDNSIDGSTEISIHPNPIKESVAHVAFSDNQEVSDIQINVVSMLGLEVLSRKIDCAEPCDSFNINFENRLSPGLYLFTVFTNEKTYRKRILVE